MSTDTIVRCDGTRDGKPCGRIVKPDPRFASAEARALVRGWWVQGEVALCGECRRDDPRARG